MSQELVTEIRGAVDIIRDFRSEALLPVFEAVINSIQAIEETNSQTRGNIVVRIHRVPSLHDEDGRKESEIEAFEICDDGIGFTDANVASFLKFGTKYKLKKGGKGIGRFTWLKAFNHVKITSIYLDSNGVHCGRRIDFSLDAIAVDDFVPPSDAPIGTKIWLHNFKKKYRTAPSACRTGQKIAQRITEHCLYYFMIGKCPRIVVDDIRSNDESLEFVLDDIFAKIKDNIVPDSLAIDKHDFKLYHLKLYGTNAQIMNNMVLCADGREVQSFDLKKHFGTNLQFDDDNKKFTYAVYVSGKYLDDHVAADRMSFELSEEDTPLDLGAQIGINSILVHVIEAAKRYLRVYLEELDKKRSDVVSNYVSTKNPALRFVPHYCPDVIKEIDPNTSDERIDQVLYSYKGKAEFELRKKSKELLKTAAKNVDGIEEKITELQTELSAVQTSNLTNYVLFRKVVIDLLDKQISICPNGKFSKEEVIHDILLPRKATSDELPWENQNLWLLDERLAFHHFAISDKEFKSYMESQSSDRGDIVLFSDVDEKTRIARSVVIIEFKRPEREEYDESITHQVLRMRKAVEAGKVVHLSNGRDIMVNSETRYYSYALCDFTDKVREAALDGDYEELPANLGFFKYHTKLRMACYVINYDQIVTDAKQRHCAFFQKLGIV